MNKSKSCTCGEPHISKRIIHCYDGKPCYVTDATTQSKPPIGLIPQKIRLEHRIEEIQFAINRHTRVQVINQSVIDLSIELTKLLSVYKKKWPSV